MVFISFSFYPVKLSLYLSLCWLVCSRPRVSCAPDLLLVVFWFVVTFCITLFISFACQLLSPAFLLFTLMNCTEFWTLS